ncbi:Viral A-type inclusion protein repeat containing protein [Aphelenchoides avenae]|nr:Viral A-type inclusion protein repeat containing protein [Aphelenchus avenae]
MQAEEAKNELERKLTDLDAETNQRLAQLQEALEKTRLDAGAGREETDLFLRENGELHSKVHQLEQAVSHWKTLYEEETRELNERDREIVHQFAELQQKYDARVASNETAAATYEERISALDAKLAEAGSELASKRTELETLTALNRQLQENAGDMQRSLQEAEQASQHLKARVDELQKEVVAAASHAIDQEQLENIKAQKEEAERRADEMTRLIQEKHAENVQYYEKITELAAANQQLTAQMEQVQAQLASSNQQLAMSYEEKGKLNNELGRLREHLLQMEEISTKEAIAAEERETELRREIQLLRQRAMAADENVVFSESSYQQELGMLREEVTRLNDKCDALSTTLSAKERQLTDTSKALSNLQTVLRDIGKDHEAEMARRDGDVRKLRAEIQDLTGQIEELQKREAQLKEDRRYHEDSAALLREELSQKCRVIDELEIQVEEAHRSAAHGSDSLESHTSTARDPSSYKIDDATLRQLFLSYLTAPRDKQPEIAIVMASILGYGTEEQKRIQSALSESDRGWFGFMRLGGRSPVPSGNASLTEQFIRFLETESLAATQPPTLPITSQASTFNLDEAPPPAARGSDYSSSSDLRSIIEETSTSSS